MKHAIKLFASLTLVLFMAVSMNAQTAITVADKSETKNCDIKNCDPAVCAAMVKAGLCTKEQAAKCKATCSAKSTKVAAATMVRGESVLVSETKEIKKASCAKKCAKTCSSKKTSKSE